MFRVPVFLLLHLLQSCSPSAYRHSLNVAKLALRTTQYAQALTDSLEMVVTAALLHDVGKTKVPIEILRKTGRLTVGEKQELKKHAEYGAEILAALNVNRFLLDYVRFHHERWDGRGNFGLKGRDIPWGARVIAVCDRWDNLTTPPAYKDGNSEDGVLQDIKTLRGRWFDPEVVELFLAAVSERSSSTLPERLASERQKMAQFAAAYGSLSHPVVYVQSLCVDDLVQSCMAGTCTAGGGQLSTGLRYQT